MPTEEEMRRWEVDNPEDGPDAVVSDEPMTPEELSAHRKKIADARDADKRHAAGVSARMSSSELRRAGVRIDLPTEAASAHPKDIAYTDGTTLTERLRKRYEESRAGKRTTGTSPPPEAGPEQGGGAGM